MADKFAVLEYQSMVRRAAGPLMLLMAIGAFFVLFWWPIGPQRSMPGVVQTSGAVSVAGIKGGTREVVGVRLTDGRIVMASVVSGGLLAPGAPVWLIEQARLLGGPKYQVVAGVSKQ